MHRPDEWKARGFGLEPSGDWQEQAACRGMADNYFDPWDADDRAEAPNAYAAQICQSCPVRRRCLIAAITNDEEFGVWGGLTRKQRKKLVRARNRKRCPICKGSLIVDDVALQTCLSCGITWRAVNTTRTRQR